MGKLYLNGKEVLADVYLKGTLQAIGTVVMPPFTLGGNISGGGWSINNIGVLAGLTAGNLVIRNVGADGGLYLGSQRTNANTGIAITLRTYNSSDVISNRLTFSGGIDTATATWTNITQEGLVLYDDINANGQGGFPRTLSFYQDNVAATQTAVALLLLGDAARDGRPAIKAGSITGIAVYSNEARSAGSCTVDATVAGTATGLQAVLDVTNTSHHEATQAKDTDTCTAGQLIGVKITTSADWAPTTADIIVEVEVEY